MSTYLPWIAVVVAVLACVFRNGIPTKGSQVEGESAPILPVTLFFVLALALTQWSGWGEGFPLFSRGVVVGAFVAGLAGWLLRKPIDSLGGMAAAFGLATAALAPTHWLPADQIANAVTMQLGVVFGAGVGAYLLGQKQGKGIPSAVAVCVALVGLAACDALGRAVFAAMESPDEGPLPANALAATGLVLGCAVTLGGLIGSFLEKTNGIIVAGLATFVVVFFGAGGFLALADIWRLALIGLVVGAVTVWLVVSEEKGNLRVVLAAALWLAAATVAFSMRRGLGMSVVFAVGVAPLVMYGSSKALLAVGPFFGFVLFRVFREGNVEASRAFDIGQHYAMVGLVAGLAMVLLASEWRKDHGGTGWRGGLASWLWIVLAIGVPIAAAFVLGPKGVVGLVVGLGVGALVEALQDRPHTVVLAMGAAIASLVSASYQWLKPVLDELTRSDKIVRMGWTFALVAVAAGVLAWLSSEDKQEVEP